jgi:hypothetical protein
MLQLQSVELEDLAWESHGHLEGLHVPLLDLVLVVILRRAGCLTYGGDSGSRREAGTQCILPPISSEYA